MKGHLRKMPLGEFLEAKRVSWAKYPWDGGWVSPTGNWPVTKVSLNLAFALIQIMIRSNRLQIFFALIQIMMYHDIMIRSNRLQSDFFIRSETFCLQLKIWKSSEFHIFIKIAKLFPLHFDQIWLFNLFFNQELLFTFCEILLNSELWLLFRLG